MGGRRFVSLPQLGPAEDDNTGDDLSLIAPVGIEPMLQRHSLVLMGELHHRVLVKR